MRMIVTGGTGLIGMAVVGSLTRAGHEVIVLTRNPSGAGHLPAGARAVRWDGRTSEGWGHLAHGAGAIINLAGESLAGAGLIPQRWTPARKRAIVQSRVQAGEAVVQAVAEAAVKPRVVIQASAIGYYGTFTEAALSESAPRGADFLARVCTDWERSTAAVEAHGVRHVVARIGVVLDGEGGALPRLALPFRLFAGGPLGGGEQVYSWIHRDDVAAALRYLAEQPDARGAYNLTAPNPVTNRAFADALGEVMGRPSWLPVPAWPLRLALGEMATVVLDGQRVLPERLVVAGYRFQFPQVSAALRNLLARDGASAATRDAEALSRPRPIR